MNAKNSKMNEPHKFVFNLSQGLDLRSSNKHVALQNLLIYYKWKNISKQHKNKKLRIIASTWNDEFELPDLILFQIFKIISNFWLKNMKHEQQFLLFMFTTIQLIIDLCLKYKMDIIWNYKRLKQWNYMVAQKN